MSREQTLYGLPPTSELIETSVEEKRRKELKRKEKSEERSWKGWKGRGEGKVME